MRPRRAPGPRIAPMEARVRRMIVGLGFDPGDLLSSTIREVSAELRREGRPRAAHIATHAIVRARLRRIPPRKGEAVRCVSCHDYIVAEDDWRVVRGLPAHSACLVDLPRPSEERKAT